MKENQNTRFVGSSDQLRYFRNSQEADAWAKRHGAVIVTGKEQPHKTDKTTKQPNKMF